MNDNTIDWPRWQPNDRATLVFVQRDHQVLLIRKRRGLGAGLITGPGGRLEAGESTRDAAIREVHEELKIRVSNLQERGHLAFQFTDGYKLHVTVFTTTQIKGEPQTTVEAVPQWSPQDNLPFAEMWADDPLWLPLALHGIAFEGRFIFDGKAMRTFHVEAVAASP